MKEDTQTINEGGGHQRSLETNKIGKRKAISICAKGREQISKTQKPLADNKVSPFHLLIELYKRIGTLICMLTVLTVFRYSF